jgi:hypothetical protein
VKSIIVPDICDAQVVCGGCGRLKILAPWIWQSISTNGYNQRLKTQYTCQWLKSGTLDLVAM